MKTMYIDISVPRIVLTRLLGKLWRSAYFAPLSPLHIVDIDDPPLPADHWVRVQNDMCGICGSDLHQLLVDSDLDISPVALPSNKRIYLGHEMVGRIVEIGSAVSRLKLGDRVVRWGRMDDCLARRRVELCQACAKGHRVLCEYSSEPAEYQPVGGGFGDQFIAPEASLVIVPKNLTDEQAIFTEPTAVAIHAAFKHLPQPGDKVMVLGVGTIGYLLIQTIRKLQPKCHISALVQFPWQVNLAKDLGADEVITSSTNNYENICKLTGAKLYEGRQGNKMLLGGFDVIYDVVGITSTVNNALRWSRAFGTVILVGVNFHRMKMDLTPVWYQEVNLIGTVGHDIVNFSGEGISTFDLALRWIGDGTIQTRPLLTHQFSLMEYRQAFNTALDKERTQSIKVAFELT